MKKLWILSALMIFVAISCNKTKHEKPNSMDGEVSNKLAYHSYGNMISENHSLTSAEMLDKYEGLKTGDTVEVSFKTTVNSVCKNKGCWMTLDLPAEEDVMVKFKDYGFFVPMDIEEKEVIVNGKAFIEEVSVEEQQHYARDNGQTDAEVAEITKPKRTPSFLADGVLIKE